MRFITIFVLGAIVFILAGAVFHVTFKSYIGNSAMEKQELYQLTGVAESNAARVSDFLENRKKDAVFLAGSEGVKKAFDKELVNDTAMAKSKVRNVAKDTAKDIETYIMEHPEATSTDLQKDQEFRKIALRRVGEEGYTFVIDYEKLVNYLHVPEKFGGMDYHERKDELPEWWALFEDLQKGLDVEGSYSWKEPDGRITRKWKYMAVVPVETADGAHLAVSATIYNNEHITTIKLLDEVQRELESFQEVKDYRDLILISPRGDVIWTAREGNDLGTNLRTGVYNNTMLARLYRRVEKNPGAAISDVDYYEASGKISIFVTAPVIDIDNETGKKLLKGIIALQIDSQQIGDLVMSDVGIEDIGEVYIINRERNHITPLKYEDSLSGEIINSELIDSCFADYDNYYLSKRAEPVEPVEKAGFFLNYARHPVLGAHQYILQSNWCVLAEVDEKEFFESHLGRWTFVGTLLNVIVYIWIVGLVVALVLDEYFKLDRKGGQK